MIDTERWWQAYLAALTGMHAYGQSDESYSIAGADRAAAQAADLALTRWRAIGAQAESSGETAAALYFAVSLHGAWEGAGEMADIDTMLENVKRLDAEATPADAWYEWTLSRDENPTRYNALGPNTYTQDAADADAALIAHYRTAAPLLAAEVERLLSVQEEILMSRKVANAEVERLRAEVAAATDHVRALVAAMAEWGTWEDGVPAAGMDSGCGTVGDVYDAARAYLAAKGAER